MFAPIPLKIMRRTDLSANAKLLYARLVLFVGENDTAWPSRETLANELGIHLRSVQRAMSELINADLIERQQGYNGHTNTYSIIESPVINMVGGITGKQLDSSAGQICPTKEDECVPLSSSEEDKCVPLSRTDMSHIKEPIKISPKKESARGQGSKEIKKSKSNRGSRITEDWQPDEGTRKRCAEKTSEQFVEEQIQCFIDYWIDITGQRGIKLAWDRAFHNWIRNEIKWGRVKSSSTGKPSGEEGRKRRRSGLASAYSKRMEGDGRTDTVH